MNEFVRWRKRSVENAELSARTAHDNRVDVRERMTKADSAWMDTLRKKRLINGAKRDKSMAQSCFSHEEMKIEVLYNRARRDDLAVDHIIPLHHPLVCGLHVLANMRMVPKDWNDRKGSKWDGTYDNLGWGSV